MTKRNKKRRTQRRPSNRQDNNVAKHLFQTDEQAGFPRLENIFASPNDLQAWRAALDSEIREKVQHLEAMLLQYSAFDMIANLILPLVTTVAEAQKKITHLRTPAIIEFVTLLYLKHPFNIGKVVFVDEPVLDAVISQVENILSSVMLYYATEHYGVIIEETTEFEESLSYFRYRTIVNELFVRNPS